MIKGKNNYKQVLLEDKVDYTIYLNQLILYAYKNMHRIKSYIKELDSLIELHKDNDNRIKPIPSYTFLELSDKIDSPMKMLLNIFADETALAASYFKFKKQIDRLADDNNDTFGLCGLKTQNELYLILRELNSTRNWYCHIPESIFIAQRYVDAASLNGMDVSKEYASSEIKVFFYENHDGEWAQQKKAVIDGLMRDFEFVYSHMKKDYSILVEDSMRVRRVYVDSKESRPCVGAEMGALSYHINKGKLKDIDLNEFE